MCGARRPSHADVPPAAPQAIHRKAQATTDAIDFPPLRRRQYEKRADAVHRPGPVAGHHGGGPRVRLAVSRPAAADRGGRDCGGPDPGPFVLRPLLSGNFGRHFRSRRQRRVRGAQPTGPDPAAVRGGLGVRLQPFEAARPRRRRHFADGHPAAFRPGRNAGLGDASALGADGVRRAGVVGGIPLVHGGRDVDHRDPDPGPADDGTEHHADQDRRDYDFGCGCGRCLRLDPAGHDFECRPSPVPCLGHADDGRPDDWVLSVRAAGPPPAAETFCAACAPSRARATWA